MKYVSFDIETAGDDPATPTGITCAATILVAGATRWEAVRWHGPMVEGRYAETMLPTNCQALTDYLHRLLKKGFVPAGWNTVGFDFRVLGEFCRSSPHFLKCVELAKEGYDPLYQMVNEKGFACKLDNAAIGMQVAGKLEGMDGASAAQRWGEDLESQELILQYVEQDVIAFANVWNAMQRLGGLRWLTRSGRISTWVPYRGWKVAKEIIGTPQRDISSWANSEMIEIFKQAKFTQWFDVK